MVGDAIEDGRLSGKRTVADFDRLAAFELGVTADDDQAVGVFRLFQFGDQALWDRRRLFM